MLQRIFSVLTSSAILSAALIASTAGEARAAEAAPAVPAPPTAGTSTTTTTAAGEAAPGTVAAPLTDEKPAVKDDDDIKRIALELNPLGVAIGRYSISGEYLFARHHAVTLTPFFAHVPVEVNDVDLGSLTGFGGELGYRFYTGSKGANGFFVGPSFLFSSYSQSTNVAVPGAAKTDSSFTAIGGAIDIGGQAIIGPGIVLGGGFGLQYTSTSKDVNTDGLNLASAIIAGGGVRPRFLLSLGYAF